MCLSTLAMAVVMDCFIYFAAKQNICNVVILTYSKTYSKKPRKYSGYINNTSVSLKRWTCLLLLEQNCSMVCSILIKVLDYIFNICLKLVVVNSNQFRMWRTWQLQWHYRTGSSSDSRWPQYKIKRSLSLSPSCYDMSLLRQIRLYIVIYRTFGNTRTGPWFYSPGHQTHSSLKCSIILHINSLKEIKQLGHNNFHLQNATTHSLC
jgi:hypothetical protein